MRDDAMPNATSDIERSDARCLSRRLRSRQASRSRGRWIPPSYRFAHPLREMPDSIVNAHTFALGCCHWFSSLCWLLLFLGEFIPQFAYVILFVFIARKQPKNGAHKSSEKFPLMPCHNSSCCRFVAPVNEPHRRSFERVLSIKFKRALMNAAVARGAQRG
jgi:hypothetical protein